MSAQDGVVVADPYGPHRSRAVTNADGSVRIALGVGPAPTDQGARAQHLALATDDVTAATGATERRTPLYGRPHSTCRADRGADASGGAYYPPVDIETPMTTAIITPPAEHLCGATVGR
ncbi:hypothetical protein [Streptomyces sp. NPDC096311]|uniref:hypothetical protein n=1 Tax=Streptomyces sp. NPDC096311 TaxID=3366083 RepID=UPI0038188510